MKKSKDWQAAYAALDERRKEAVESLHVTLDYYYKVIVELAAMAGYEAPPKCH